MPAAVVYVAGIVVLALAWVIAQERFYEESRKDHGLWRPWYDRWTDPTWGELSAMASQTFERQRGLPAERARRRYVAITAIGLMWLLIGGAITLVVIR